MKSLEEIVSTTIRMRAPEMAKSLEQNALLRRLIENMPPPRKLTRMERAQRRIEELNRRIRDAVKVLRGEAQIAYDEE